MLPPMRVDTQSESWILVEQFIAAEKLAAFKQLTDPRNNLEATQFHRGIVAALERLEALAVEQPRPLVEMPIDYEVGGV